MKKSVLCLLALTCFALGADGQKHHYLSVQSGLGLGKARDHMNSPLIYKGLQVPSALSYIRETDTAFRKINLQFTWGNLKPDIHPDKTNTTFSRFKFQGSFQSFSKVSDWQQSDFSLYLGGSWDNLLTFRSSTFSGLNFGEFTSTMNFRPKLNYEFQMYSHRAKLQYNIGFPFLTFMLRRGYANSPPQEFQKDEEANDNSFVKKAYESGRFLRPFRFIRLNSQLSFSYYLENGNQLTITYGFDYYEYEDPELIESVSHNLMIGTAFNF